MRAVIVAGCCAALALGCGGCKGRPVVRPKVAVTIFPVYDLVRRVAGPDADVLLLLPPGRPEHHFDPTPHEIEEVAGAKLGVMVGLGLDPWMEALLHDAAPLARLLKVGDRVPTIPIKANHVGDKEAHANMPDDHDEAIGSPDPHVWMDPQRAILMTKVIGEELARLDSSHATAYRTRATEVAQSLDALDREVEGRVISWKTKTFVTFHGSFAYFADRYHLQVAAVIEPYPGDAPTLKYVQAVLKVVFESKVPAIFSEPQLDPKPARLIGEAAHIPLGILDPVGGGPDTDTYEKLIRFDVDALEKALK
jgi:zinc transport system substrate-binding protein